MRYHKVLTIVVTLSILLLLAGPSILATQQAQAQDSASLLNQIARDAVEAENQLLVSGERSVLDNIQTAAAFRDLVQGRIPELNMRREALAENQQIYTSFRTQLTVTRVKVRRIKATLWATEKTVFDLESPGAPPSTGYEVNHRFAFVFEDEGWKLVADDIIDELNVETPSPGEIPVDAPSTMPGKVSNNEDGDGDFQIATYAIQRQAIANYATRYWSTYNSRYRAETNDCTNFVSQALYAGLWPMTGGYYTSNSAWWYNFSAAWPGPYHSYPWGAAHNFFLFTNSSNRTNGIAQYFSQLQVGDILQADLYGSTSSQPDGHIDHSMVVTGKATNGELYLTYHTTNNLNKTLSSLRTQYPNARWYGWRLKNIF